MKGIQMTRKNFIGGMLAAGVAPSVVPSSVFGANAPSNRITLAGVGIGGIGSRQLPLTLKGAGAYPLPTEGTLYFGTKGVVLVDTTKATDCKLVFFDKALEAKAAALPRTKPRRKGWIYGEWLEACKGGEPASCNFDFAQYITEFVQLGNLALQTQKPVEFDPAAMKVTNGNDAADALLHSHYENGWKFS